MRNDCNRLAHSCAKWTTLCSMAMPGPQSPHLEPDKPAGESLPVEGSADAAVESAKPPSRVKRCIRFVLDVIALHALLLGCATLAMLLLSLYFTADVSAVRGVTLRIAAGVFFFRVFQFHVAAVVFIAALVALVVRYRKIAVFNLLLAIVLALPLIWSYRPKSPPPISGPALKVYSANLYVNNHDGDAIVRSIRAENPDVIVLMELTPWSHALLMDAFGESHPYQHRPHYNGGGMVFSRVPFREDRPVVQLAGNHTRVPLVFNLGGKELALYPVHLLSPGRLGLVAEHREQMREFIAIAEHEARPMVIVGDCNMTPRTPNFQAMENVGFRSTWQLAGRGPCNTWGPRWWPRLNALPGVQIDQVLLQEPMTATSHRVGMDTGSDHRPIVAEIGFVRGD